MRFKITVSNRKYNAEILGVKFSNGVAYTDSEKVAKYMKNALRYTVEEIATPDEPVEPVSERPASSKRKRKRKGDKND